MLFLGGEEKTSDRLIRWNVLKVALRVSIYTSNFAQFEERLQPVPWRGGWVCLGEVGNSYLSLQDQAKGLLGHGMRDVEHQFCGWTRKNKCQSCFSPPFVLWARLGGDSRQLYYALLTTENKTMWIFKAAVLNSGHKYVVSKMLIAVEIW